MAFRCGMPHALIGAATSSRLRNRTPTWQNTRVDCLLIA
jgi:hypothetical protein